MAELMKLKHTHCPIMINVVNKSPQPGEAVQIEPMMMGDNKLVFVILKVRNKFKVIDKFKKILETYDEKEAEKLKDEKLGRTIKKSKEVSETIVDSFDDLMEFLKEELPNMVIKDPEND